jgi:hypothetical protein
MPGDDGRAPGTITLMHPAPWNLPGHVSGETPPAPLPAVMTRLNPEHGDWGSDFDPPPVMPDATLPSAYLNFPTDMAKVRPVANDRPRRIVAPDNFDGLDLTPPNELFDAVGPQR